MAAAGHSQGREDVHSEEDTNISHSTLSTGFPFYRGSN